ncbi:MAG: hypothetical protein EZS28_016512 [Streblomastix strix]|uniref:Uncharacterized protein n=1 Tax=Streblomastix strix TaxID=222440 RepID=A0A5J4VZ54_9EUKA|nr:MAG: hypothetical protein EZS28_016512 [Streblomastix strix]
MDVENEDQMMLESQVESVLKKIIKMQKLITVKQNWRPDYEYQSLKLKGINFGLYEEIIGGGEDEKEVIKGRLG